MEVSPVETEKLRSLEVISGAFVEGLKDKLAFRFTDRSVKLHGPGGQTIVSVWV